MHLLATQHFSKGSKSKPPDMQPCNGDMSFTICERKAAVVPDCLSGSDSVEDACTTPLLHTPSPTDHFNASHMLLFLLGAELAHVDCTRGHINCVAIIALQASRF